MTQSRTPSTKPSIPVPRRNSENAPAPPNDEEIPRGEFIDVVTNKPVEPSRLQVFPVPEEFLNKVHASKPPHLRPDDVKDTVPRGLPQQRPAEPVPASAKAPINSPDEPPRSSAASPASSSRTPTQRPRSTVHLRPRPPASALTRWALTGKIPVSVKISFAAIIGGLFLVLLWQNWDMGARSSNSASVEPLAETPGAPVPLIDAPTPSIAAANAVPTPEPLAAPAASIAANEPKAAINVQSVSDLPVINDAPKEVASAARRTQTRIGTSPGIASKSSESVAPVHAGAAASSGARSSITPLFEPR
jgi:hypothetical protein